MLGGREFAVQNLGSKGLRVIGVLSLLVPTLQFGPDAGVYKPPHLRSFSPGQKESWSYEGGGTLRDISADEWTRFELPTFEKNFYKEHPEVSSLTAEAAQSLRSELEVQIEGEDIPNPISTFDQAGFPDYILAQTKEEGFVKPTPVQSQSWPIAMQGRDLIAVSETGSGKTLSFLLPSIVHINAQPALRAGDGPIVLVLIPTRELAQQVYDVAARYGKSSRLKSVCVFGGSPKGPQASALRRGADICIATPGRLIDFLERDSTNLRRVTYLVLDEADRMLDMGFEPQLRKICGQIRKDRQTLMFTATWPQEVQEMARDFLAEPVIFYIGSRGLKAVKTVAQYVEVLDHRAKGPRLMRVLSSFLQDVKGGKVLVFAATKRKCDELTFELRRSSINCLGIHGDKEQREREWVLAQFKSGACQVLVATDVASRGIHVDDIMLVINYDMPNQIEDYVHRIGRTGRAGRSGTAYSFFTYEDASTGHLGKGLISVLQRSEQKVPDDLFAILDEAKLSKHSRRNSFEKRFSQPQRGGNSFGPPTGPNGGRSRRF